MTQEQKTAFRMSKPWKNFRAKCKKQYGYIDFVTKKVLARDWNLHHLDLRTAHYTQITDTQRFIPLNSDTHKFVHWLYRLWTKDKAIIARLEQTMVKMNACSKD